MPTAPLSPIGTARPTPTRFRRVRAYAVAARVGLSYVAFEVVEFVLGAGWSRWARPRLHARNGRRVRDAVLRLRGLFLKAGQLASVLTGFLPEPFRRPLDALQDRVPGSAYAGVADRIRGELGAEPDALFASIDRAPIASASLAQVHRAVLADGRTVAVKVQHADIEAVAEVDLRAIERILRVVGGVFGVRGLREQLAEIEAVIRAELDFSAEAVHTTELAAVLAPAAEDTMSEAPALDRVAVPSVIPHLSRRRVLTTTFEPGVKITDLEQLAAWGVDRRELAGRLVDAYARMVFRDGVYHADPHPGNLLVRADGTLVFLDFGAVGRLTEPMRRGLAEFMLGVLLRDARRVTESLGVMGFVARDADGAAAIATLVERVHERILKGLDPADFKLSDLTLDWAAAQHADTFDEMADLGISVRDLAGAFEVPKDWILIERTVLLIIGVLTQLAPDFNPLERVWPHLRSLAGDDAPSLTSTATATLREAAQTALTLPRRIDTVLGLAERGELRVASSAPDGIADAIGTAGRRLVWTVAAGGGAALALAADAVGRGALAGGFWTMSGVFGAALVGSLAGARRARLKALRRS